MCLFVCVHAYVYRMFIAQVIPPVVIGSSVAHLQHDFVIVPSRGMHIVPRPSCDRRSRGMHIVPRPSCDRRCRGCI